jgi:ParB family chromosome partitioning protein
MGPWYSSSGQILGIIEDVDLSNLKHPPTFYPTISSGLNDLTWSIRKKGLLHPIIVRAVNEGNYEIVAGNRRYLACKALGWRKILCHIVELDDREAFEISLVENIQRRTLHPIEEAHAFKIYVSDFGWGGVSDLASKIGKSVSYVDRRLGLLKLPDEIIQMIKKSSISVTAAEELVPIQSELKQSQLAEAIEKKGMSIKFVRELIRSDEESVYDFEDKTSNMYTEDISDIDRITQRSFDKSIIAIRMAMNKLSSIIEHVEDNWIIYEILMHHRNILHNQIDTLIKEKKKV